MIGGIGPLRATQYVRAPAPAAASSGVAATETPSRPSNGGAAGATATATFAGGLSQSTLLTAQASGGSSQSSADGLTEEEQAVVREMKQTDAKVRAHEMAHLAVGGQYASGPYYEYDKGPDGGLYVVAGEVNIDTSPVPGDPEATIAKANQIRAAALAPSDPSAQDRSVANAAAQMAAKASVEAAKQKNGETGDTTSPPTETQSRRPNSQTAQAASNAYDAVTALVAAAQQPTLNLAA
jgi:hypothetical protein